MRIPHTRGDGPLLNPYNKPYRLYSPHAWGWTMLNLRLDQQTKGIPHTRGDGPFPEVQSRDITAYSPHAWGWTNENHQQPLRKRVFPTRVGMDLQGFSICPKWVSIPHTRGDGPWLFNRYQKYLNVFPTRVGMDR